MAWGRISTRTSYLVELDMAKRTSETWTGRESDEWLVPERLYVEYSASELIRLRVGRFLTPIGIWNEQHAEPLTWTPTRPLTTYLPFAKSLDGVLVAGEASAAGRDVGYAVYWAPPLRLGRDLEQAEESSFVHAFGGRFAVEPRPGVTLGLAAARVRRSRPAEVTGDPLDSIPAAGTEGRDEDASARSLFGMDLRWTTSRLEIVGEGNVVPAAEGEPVEGGAYGIASVRLSGPLWMVVRGEVYRPLDGATARIAFAGLALRADRRLVVKLGRQFVQRSSVRIPDGWFLSFSSLF
jgi:hypothetical protein